MKAFPTEHPIAGTMGLHADGMNLRDYFAAKAMQSLILIHEKDSLCDFSDGILKDLALISYSYADSMMETRENDS